MDGALRDDDDDDAAGIDGGGFEIGKGVKDLK